MKKTLNVLIIICFSLVLSSCAAIMKSIAESSCTSASAYAAGYNDGKANQNMRSDYASICAAIQIPKQQQNALNLQYQKGYKEGIQIYTSTQPNVVIIDKPSHHSKRNQWQCIDTFNGKVCGYHCIKDGLKAICAQKPSENCIITPFKSKCGYGCVKNINGIYCAPYPGYRCHIGQFNQIVCGKNCYKDRFGTITCQRTVKPV